MIVGKGFCLVGIMIAVSACQTASKNEKSVQNSASSEEVRRAKDWVQAARELQEQYIEKWVQDF